ncbi:10817_t:CDS:1, partial [Cetraspora pellucida]
SESLSTNTTGNSQIITVGESLSNSRRKYDTSPIENYVDNRIP